MIPEQPLGAEEKALLRAWGWSQPNEEVVAMAHLSLRLQRCKSGEAVVLLGLADEQTVNNLLLRKPANVLTQDWLCKHLPQVRDEAPKLLTLSAGVQYVSQLTQDDLHPFMRERPAISRYCDTLDAVLIRIEGRAPALVFADFTSMTKFAQMGREDRLKDPVRTELLEAGELEDVSDLIIAVGNRRNVMQINRDLNLQGDPAVTSDDNQDDVWSKHKARTESQRVLSRLMDMAIDQNVTDVSIAPYRDGSGYVLLRRYGDMIPPDSHSTLDAGALEEIARFLMSRSRANPEGGRIREPKDGQFSYKSGAVEVFVRCSFIPLDRGGMDQDMVSISLRLLPRKIGSVELSELNMKPHAIEEVTRVASFSQGLIVLAGPTNSGKSTTIAGIVGEHVRLYGTSRKRLSIEDPVERYLPGVLHISVPPHLENGFATIFRSVLRHDPDVVWIGEIRDRETAATCVRAAASGHLVFTTVHANDSVGAWKEIANMVDAEKRFNLIESLSMLISQRLVKRICQRCVQDSQLLTDEERRTFVYYCRMHGIAAEPPERVARANPSGCLHCHGGYDGVLPLHEILPVSREVKDRLMEMDASGHFNYREISGHRVITLFDSGMELVREGRVDLMDILV